MAWKVSECHTKSLHVSLLCPRWVTPGLRPPKAAPLHNCRASVWGGGCRVEHLGGQAWCWRGSRVCPQLLHTISRGRTCNPCSSGVEAPGACIPAVAGSPSVLYTRWGPGDPQRQVCSRLPQGLRATGSPRHRPPPLPSAPSEEGASQRGSYWRGPSRCGLADTHPGAQASGEALASGCRLYVSRQPRCHNPHSCRGGHTSLGPVGGRRRGTSRALIALD